MQFGEPFLLSSSLRSGSLGLELSLAVECTPVKRRRVAVHVRLQLKLQIRCLKLAAELSIQGSALSLEDGCSKAGSSTTRRAG